MDHKRRDQSEDANTWTLPGYEVTQTRPGQSVGISRGLAIRRIDGLEVQLTRLDMPTGQSADDIRSGEWTEQAMAIAADISRIRHEHIIRIHDVLPVSDDAARRDHLVLVTEAVSGGSLTSRLPQRRPMPLAQAITVVLPIGDALHHVHLSGHVHAGLTTDTVVFDGAGKPLLTDIGLAAIGGRPLSAVGGFEGCVAPEVLEGYAPSVESDAYAFAALVWQMLTGEPPGWVGGRPELDEVAGDQPQAIRDVVSRALSAEPEERPEVCEIVAEFHALGPGEPIGADGDLTSDIPARIRAMATRHTTSHRAPARRSRGAAVAMMAAISLLALIAAIVVVPALRGTSEEPRASTEMLVAQSLGTGPDVDDGASTNAPRSQGEPFQDELPADPSQPWRDAVQEVLGARAAAWESGDPDLLGRAHAAGSEALAKDREDLLRAAHSGADFSGVEFVAEGIEITDIVPAETQDIAAATEFSAHVVVARGPLRVMTDNEEPQIVQADSEVVNLRLRREPDGWRLWSWD